MFLTLEELTALFLISVLLLIVTHGGSYKLRPLRTWSKPFLKTKIQVMKKFNTLLHNVDVQGSLVTVTIFAVIIVLSIITWGK